MLPDNTRATFAHVTKRLELMLLHSMVAGFSSSVCPAPAGVLLCVSALRRKVHNSDKNVLIFRNMDGKDWLSRFGAKRVLVSRLHRPVSLLQQQECLLDAASGLVGTMSSARKRAALARLKASKHGGVSLIEQYQVCSWRGLSLSLAVHGRSLVCRRKRKPCLMWWMKKSTHVLFGNADRKSRSLLTTVRLLHRCASVTLHCRSHVCRLPGLVAQTASGMLMMAKSSLTSRQAAANGV